MITHYHEPIRIMNHPVVEARSGVMDGVKLGYWYVYCSSTYYLIYFIFNNVRDQIKLNIFIKI